MKITLADWTKYLNFVTNGLDCPICRRQKWETSTRFPWLPTAA